jgi:hypothetical protein
MREEEKKFRGEARECEEGSEKLGANFVTEFQELLFPPYKEKFCNFFLWGGGWWTPSLITIVYLL